MRMTTKPELIEVASHVDTHDLCRLPAADPSLTGNDLIVLYTILAHINSRSGVGSFSRDWLQETTRLSRSAITRSLASLRQRVLVVESGSTGKSSPIFIRAAWVKQTAAVLVAKEQSTGERVLSKVVTRQLSVEVNEAGRWTVAEVGSQRKIQGSQASPQAVENDSEPETVFQDDPKEIPFGAEEPQNAQEAAESAPEPAQEDEPVPALADGISHEVEPEPEPKKPLVANSDRWKARGFASPEQYQQVAEFGDLLESKGLLAGLRECSIPEQHEVLTRAEELAKQGASLQKTLDAALTRGRVSPRSYKGRGVAYWLVDFAFSQPVREQAGEAIVSDPSKGAWDPAEQAAYVVKDWV